MIEFNKVFIDTAPLIYYLEQNPQYYKKTRKFFGECYELDTQLVTSVITIEEYCVFPFRNSKLELIQNFYKFLYDMEFDLIDVNDSIAKKAAQIRAFYKDFKAMDALQLATACLTGCDLFLTNDKQLIQFTEKKCITIEEL